MKSIKTHVLVVLVALSSVLAFGAEPDLGSHAQLRDILPTCDWIPAADLVAGLKVFPDVLKSVSNVNWYLASVLGREPSGLKVCNTKQELKAIPPEETEGLTTVAVNGKLVAVRLADMVFLDQTTFAALAQDQQALVVVQALLHSLIPHGTPLRNEKVASMVGAIARNYTAPATKEHFALQMLMNDVSVPNDLTVLDPFKTQLLVAFDESATESNREATAHALSVSLAALPDQAAQHMLRKRDLETIDGLTKQLNLDLVNALVAGDVATAKAKIAIGADINESLIANPCKSPALSAALAASFALINTNAFGAAVCTGDLELVSMMLKTRDAASQLADVQKGNLLQLAAYRNDLPMVNLLLTVPGVDVKTSASSCGNGADAFCKADALRAAAAGGSVAVLKAMLAAPSADLTWNVYSGFGQTPLSIALFAQNWETARYLLSNVALRQDIESFRDWLDARLGDQTYLASVAVPIAKGQVDIVELLIQKGFLIASTPAKTGSSCYNDPSDGNSYNRTNYCVDAGTGALDFAKAANADPKIIALLQATVPVTPTPVPVTHRSGD